MSNDTLTLREALRSIQYEAVSLGDAQVIALQALNATYPARAALSATQPAQAAQPSGAHMNHSDVEELARKANLAQMNNAPEGVFIVDAQALSLFAALVLEKAIAASGRQS